MLGGALPLAWLSGIELRRAACADGGLTLTVVSGQKTYYGTDRWLLSV